MLTTRTPERQSTINVEDEIVETVDWSSFVAGWAGINSVIRRADASNTHSGLAEFPDSVVRQ